MFNEYPYTDYHELNTDWIIGKIKNVETAEANTKQYAEDADAAKVAAEDARDISVQAKDDAEAARDAAHASEINAGLIVTDTQNQITLLQSRVDNIIPDGTQTVGNTELLDIRVGFSGITYTSAGDAVRAQVTDMQSAIDATFEKTNSIDDVIPLPWYTEIMDYKVDKDTGNTTANTGSETSNYIICDDISKFVFPLDRLYDKYTWAFYDDSKVFISGGERNTYSLPATWTVNVPATAKYFRISYFTIVKSTFYINGSSKSAAALLASMEKTENLDSAFAQISDAFKEKISTGASGLYNFSSQNIDALGGYAYAQVSVTPGEVYLINAQTINSNYRAWQFVDASNNYISYAGDTAGIYNDHLLKAPASAVYLIINARVSDVSNYGVYAVNSDKIDNYATYLNDFVNMADCVKRVRAGSKTFGFDNINDGYITVIFDDGRHDLADVAAVFADYNIPLCVAIPSSQLPVVADNGDTIKTICDGIVSAGGEVLSHGVDGSVLTDKNDIDQIKYMLMDSKEQLVANGYNIRGFIRPGGTGAIAWNGNNLQRFTQLFYDYGDICGDDAEYNKPRSQLGSYTQAQLEAVVDSIKANNEWRTFMAHTLDGSEGNLDEAFLRSFITYALAQGIQFKTYAYMYDTFGTFS